jgi:glycosyltransferase involved in cell wall biosynthesis
VRDDSPRSLLDIAPTLAYFLGVKPPSQSVGRVLIQRGGISAADSSRVCVVIPARNEAKSIGAVIGAIPDAALGREADVVVVDDGSDDETGEIARRQGAVVLRHEHTRGLGAALRTGLNYARDSGAVAAVYIDADGEYDPLQIPDLLRPVLEGRSDYVLGSRFKGDPANMRAVRRAGNLFLSAGLSLLAGKRISDGQSGFRAFSRIALEVFEIRHDYNYAQVLTLNLLRKGMRMTEVPVSYRLRRHGRSFIRIGEYIRRVVPAMLREAVSE